MNKIKIYFTIFSFGFFSNGAFAAITCPELSHGKYGVGVDGAGLEYRETPCHVMIKADQISRPGEVIYKYYRNVLINKEGLIQVVSNFPGTTNSNSTLVRDYYLFPALGKTKLFLNSENLIEVTHPSGAIFLFDKMGRFNSAQLEMSLSKEINSSNKGGVEIESYSKGIVVDFGSSLGITPIVDGARKITVKDKNKKQCKITNNELMYIYGTAKNKEADLRFKTNEELYNFFLAKCPDLDLSDFLTRPLQEKLNAVQEAKKVPNISNAPSSAENSSARVEKPQIASDEMSDLMAALDKEDKERKMAQEKMNKEKAKEKTKSSEDQKKNIIK